MVVDGTKWSTVRAAFAGIRTPTIQHEDKKTTKEAEIEEEEEVDGDDLLREKETEYVLEERQLAQLAMLWTALVRSLGVLCLCGRTWALLPCRTLVPFSFPTQLEPFKRLVSCRNVRPSGRVDVGADAGLRVEQGNMDRGQYGGVPGGFVWEGASAPRRNHSSCRIFLPRRCLS